MNGGYNAVKSIKSDGLTPVRTESTNNEWPLSWVACVQRASPSACDFGQTQVSELKCCGACGPSTINTDRKYVGCECAERGMLNRLLEDAHTVRTERTQQRRLRQ